MMYKLVFLTGSVLECLYTVYDVGLTRTLTYHLIYRSVFLLYCIYHICKMMFSLIAIVMRTDRFTYGGMTLES